MTKGQTCVRKPCEYWQGWMNRGKGVIIASYCTGNSIRKIAEQIQDTTGERISNQTVRTYLHKWNVQLRKRGGDTRSKRRRAV